MAKQNFLAGGYIGKLGQTVGQRWKDQKIIRTYVKPANPNTPAQQSARQMFATANKLAQEAMNINGHTGVWDTSTCPEYSQRVGQAMRRLRAGYSEQESLPLYPEGSIPETCFILSDFQHNTVNDTFTFYTTGYGVSVPTAVEISFYSPEDYLNGNFTEYIIHGTVDATAKTFTVDCSANNTTDAEDVRNFFKTAMAFGFVSLYPSFYDTLGVYLQDIVIQRGYTITDKLYDFNKALPIIDVTQKVELQQNVQLNMTGGTILPPVEDGYPFIARVQAQNTYYGGYNGNSSTSDFITITGATGTQFTNTATANAKYLESTSNETIYLQNGLATKQLYRDTSTQQFQVPQITVTLTSVEYTPGSPKVYFTFDNPDALIDVPQVHAHTGYLQQGQDIQDFNPDYRTLTREADGRYSYEYGRNFTAEGKLIIYAYIQALNDDDSLHDVVTISIPDYENGNLLYVSRMPSQKFYPYTLNMFPIDLYRTDGLPLTIAPEKAGGSELFVSLAWGSVGNIETTWRNYSFTAGATETTETITSTEQVFTDVKEVMFYQFFNIYEENGRKEVEYTFTNGSTPVDITATTEWAPANGWNITFQFDPAITLWAKQVGAVYNSGFEGEWAEHFSSQNVAISETGVANMTIDDDFGIGLTNEATYMQPVFTFYDKNGTAITGVTGGGNTTPATGRMYFAKTPRVSNTRFDVVNVIDVTDTYIDVEFEDFPYFMDEVRLDDSGEILEYDEVERIGWAETDVPTILSTTRLRITASDTNRAFIGSQTNNWCYHLISGLGANTTLYFNANI